MRVLFHNGAPRGVAAALRDDIVEEARSRNWDTLKNGELLEPAEAAAFDVLTTDRNIRHQQNLIGRKLAEGYTPWSLIRLSPKLAITSSSPPSAST
jgi:hypothetical protein